MSQTETKPRSIAQQETNMSLDNNSRIGRTATEELVPSRYAVRVGEIDVLVVSDGVLPLPTEMLGHNADPAARATWLGEMFFASGCFRLVAQRRPGTQRRSDHPDRRRTGTGSEFEPCRALASWSGDWTRPALIFGP